MTDRQRHGRNWLEAHSAAADSLTSAQIEAFVDPLRDQSARPQQAGVGRHAHALPPTTQGMLDMGGRPRGRAHRPQSMGRGASPTQSEGEVHRGRTGGPHWQLMPTSCSNVPQSLLLAEACAAEGTWGPIVECFVLVMALCGLRPGEAAGLLCDDIEFPPGDGPGWLVVRRSHRPTGERWLDPDEDPEWGPLKDRDLTEVRRVPIPSVLVTKLRRHLELYGEGPGGLVFHRNDKAFDRDMFARSVWEPARSKLFPRRTDLAPDDPRQPKLSRPAPSRPSARRLFVVAAGGRRLCRLPTLVGTPNALGIPRHLPGHRPRARGRRRPTARAWAHQRCVAIDHGRPTSAQCP